MVFFTQLSPVQLLIHPPELKALVHGALLT